jgi:hypothetical protein
VKVGEVRDKLRKRVGGGPREGCKVQEGATTSLGRGGDVNCTFVGPILVCIFDWMKVCNTRRPNL